MADDPTLLLAAPLDHRGVVAVRGADGRTFLQGLISQDMEKIDAAHAAYGALLTPQGKFLHEFCIAELDGDIVLECESARAADLVARLSRFRLRAKVELIDLSAAFQVLAVFAPGAPERAPRALELDPTPGAARAFANGVAFTDPRRAELGCRAIVPDVGAAMDALEATPTTADEYDRARLALGVPDGKRDLEVEKSTLLEANFDVLNGVDWDKGCYMGQELTARTHYRGLIKQRLVPIRFDGTAPPAGTPIMAGDKAVGKIRSTARGVGLASLRLTALDEAVLTAGEGVVSVAMPDWLRVHTIDPSEANE